MCRASNFGGRRCNGHTPYGIERRNLQAQKQYYSHKMTGGLSASDEKKVAAKLSAVTNKLDALLAEKKSLGQVKSYVMKLTPNTERVLKQLEDDGFTPYIVGGSVRDVLMGLGNKDVDIEVYGGQPDSIAQSLRKIGQVDEVGKSFGVLKINIQGEDFDVSLPRIDSKVGDGHRGFTVEVNPDLTLAEATARRDYTINALMYSHRLGFIIDQHSGLKDLDKKQLKHVSDAFDEDPLRVLRGVQMASRFGMNLHPETVEKAKSLQDEYKHLAVERVQIEFQKLYEKGKDPAAALRLLKETEWDKNLPGLAAINDEKLHSAAKQIQTVIDSGAAPKEKKAVYLSAVISARMSPEDRIKFLSETTVGDSTKNMANNLTQVAAPDEITDFAVRNWARKIPRGLTVRDWAAFEAVTADSTKAAKFLKKAEQLNVADSYEPDFINGDQVLALHPERRPGAWVKGILDAAREAQYSNVFRSREQGSEWLKSFVV